MCLDLTASWRIYPRESFTILGATLCIPNLGTAPSQLGYLIDHKICQGALFPQIREGRFLDHFAFYEIDQHRN